MKYRVKQPEGEVVYYDRVCIRCGKQQKYAYNHGSGTPKRPRPNTPKSYQNGNRVSCLFGSHNYYFEDEVEPIE